MRFVHSLKVPLELQDAQAAFRDLEMLATCLPGASLEQVGEQVATGRVQVKVGPIALTYRGEVRESGNANSDSLRFVADAKEIKGLGEANATITLDFVPAGSQTDVKVGTELSVSGRLTQFGGGVIADVADQIFDEFVTNLRQRIGDAHSGADVVSGRVDAPAADTSINALSYLGRPVRERMPSVLGGLVVALVLVWWIRASRLRRTPVRSNAAHQYPRS